MFFCQSWIFRGFLSHHWIISFFSISSYHRISVNHSFTGIWYLELCPKSHTDALFQVSHSHREGNKDRVARIRKYSLHSRVKVLGVQGEPSLTSPSSQPDSLSSCFHGVWGALDRSWLVHPVFGWHLAAPPFSHAQWCCPGAEMPRFFRTASFKGRGEVFSVLPVAAITNAML